MTKRPLPWWQIPAIVTGVLASLGALGGLAINYATYAALPKKVEASEQKNAQQDEQLTELRSINKTWLNIYQQQQTPNQAVPPRVERLWDSEEQRWYCQALDHWWWETPQELCL